MPRKNTRKGTPKKRVYFKVAAPEANEVALVGDFNNWDPEAKSLKQDKKGVWKAYLTLELRAYEYRFLGMGNGRTTRMPR